jgi:hypothetical protein
MGKYRQRTREEAKIDKNTVSPYMRGIGCLFMLIVPIFSYGVGDYLAEMGFGARAGILPPEWYGRISVPPALANFQGLNVVANFLATRPHLTATLVFALVVLLVVGGILSIVFGYLYSILAPSKYGPTDVPAPRIKTKKYKR